MKKLIHFPYQHALVLGLAKSGTAAANLLLDQGLTVRVNDMKASAEDQSVINLKARGAEVVLGGHPLSVLDGVELLVKNPGIPYDQPVVAEAVERGIPVITEIEIAARLAEGKTIGITGSNGKTTTTTLVTEMLKKSHVPVKAAGNIGLVASEVVKTLGSEERLVLELSSFQLQGTLEFRPDIAVLLNLYEAHLDYHKSVANYHAAKCNIFKNQSADDYVVYNADDAAVAAAVTAAKSKKVPFSLEQQLENGAWLSDDAVYFKDERIISRADIVLVGEHNLANILAAVAAAMLAGASGEGIREVLTSFSGVRHRLQYVGKLHGRQFYNDSKATNILATQKALASFSQPVILLCGGLDRGNGFDELLPSLTHVKGMVTFGETANKLEAAGNDAKVQQIEHAETMQEAVEKAYRMSAEEDVILLSPACASWDQYPTFEKRGDMFIDAVHNLV